MSIKSKKITTIITTGSLVLSAGFVIGIGGWFGGGASIPADTMTRGLVGYWGFEEGVGAIAYDGSGNGNDGTLTNGPSWTQGKVGGALSFDGVNDYVNVPDNDILDLTTTLTIEAWVKYYSIPGVPSNTSRIVVKSAGGGGTVPYAFSVGHESYNYLHFQYYDGSSWHSLISDSSIPITEGVWHHAAVTFNKPNVYFYVDGKQGILKNFDYTLPISNGALQISDTWFRYQGTIDEARIYNRALTAEEIRYHYNRGGPVAQWKFDEGSGSTVYDSTDNNNDGTWSGNGTHWATGKYGTAGQFNGTDDYVNAGNGASLNVTNAITVEAWIKMSAYHASTYSCPVSKANNIGTPVWARGYDFEVTNVGGATFRLGNTVHNVGSSFGTVSLSTWYHLVGTWDGTTVRTYLNGVQVDSNVFDGPIYTTKSLYLGNLDNNFDHPFNGLIDDVRIYNYARTADEIRLDYNAGFAAKVGGTWDFNNGLAGYWSMNEGSGTTAYDGSGSNNNGTLTNGPSWTSGAPCPAGASCGGGLSFDGVNDYVNAGNNASLNLTTAITLEAWAYIKAFTTNVYIVGKSSNIGDPNWGRGYSLETYSPNKVIFFLSNGTTYKNIISYPSQNTWHHFVGTWQTGETMKLFIDGVLQGETSFTGPIYTYYNVEIGRMVYSNYFNGLIDEVRIYNRALSAEEIRYHYNRGGPVAQWKFDEGSGTTAYDETENNNNGTLTNFSSTDTGTATSGGNNTLTQTGKTWTTNQWANGTINITGGTGSGQTRTILSNTADTITVTSNWTINPDATSTYSLSQATAWATGKYGTALQFDGKDDYVNAANGASLNMTGAVTLEAWMYPFSSTGIYGGGIINKGSSIDNTVYGIYFWSDRLYLREGNGIAGEEQYVSAGISLSAWQHVVVTFDSSTKIATYYVNGINKGTKTFTNGMGTNSVNVEVGHRTGSAYFNGLIDDVRIYNYARTADEILIDYNEGLAAKVGSGTYDFTNGLVGYWPMNEGSGTTAYDGSGNGNNGTLTNNPSWTQGKTGNGGALSFDGVNDYVNCGTNTSLKPTDAITVELWIKTTQAALADVVSGGNFKYLMYYHGNLTNKYMTWVVVRKNGGWIHVDNTNLPLGDGNWHYIVGTFNGTQLMYYQDGVWVATKNFAADTIDTDTNPLTLGCRYNGLEPFNGLIDDVRIYNRALSAEEIRYHYNHGRPVAQWRLDEGTGQIAFDESDNNNDGTLGSTTSPDDNDPTWVAGQYNTALSFDGANDYVSVSHSASLIPTAAITAEAWVKPNAGYGNVMPRIIEKDDGKPIRIAMYLPTSQLTVAMYIAGTQRVFVVPGVFPIDVWTHVAATYDGSTCRVYFNGVLKLADSTYSGTLGTSTGSFYIGGLSGSDRALNGLIDDVRIYNYARSAEEILVDYNQGLATHFK